jgi:hypothetical protein
MSGGARRHAGGALLVAASLAAFWGVAARVDPALAGTRRGPLPLPEPERGEVLRVLRLYQQILADFHASGGVPTLLDDFPATKGVRHRVFREIGFLRDRGLVQVLDLADAIPISAERTSDGSVEVVLFEEWNWTLQRAADRKLLTEVKGFGQGFRYGLVRERGGWVVAWWRPEGVARPSTPPEFKF